MKTMRTSEVKLLEHYNWVPDNYQSFHKTGISSSDCFFKFQSLSDSLYTQKIAFF